jgi:hypothetical protein
MMITRGNPKNEMRPCEFRRQQFPRHTRMISNIMQSHINVLTLNALHHVGVMRHLLTTYHYVAKHSCHSVLRA